jgi:hypothetical protein
MSFDNNGGSDNTNMGDSPSSAGESSELDSVGSSANEPPMSARDFLSKRQGINEKQNIANRKAARLTNAESEGSVAGSEEEASEQEDNSRLSKKAGERERDVPNPKFQQRVDKLTARYHEAEKKAAQKDVEIEKYRKATDILQKELERVSKYAKLDPREERIKQLEYEREVEQFTNGLNNKQEEIYNSSVTEHQIQSRADEILDEVNELAQEYDMVSPEEILIAMRDRGETATQAARSLHNARLARASKRTAVSHPSTVGRTGAQGTNPVEQPYRGASTIKNFFEARIAERNGKAE